MNQKTYDMIEAAFKEGWNSYDTACCAFNNADSAWESSAAKSNADALRALTNSKKQGV